MKINRNSLALTGVAVATCVLAAACGSGTAASSTAPDQAAGHATSCTVISSAEASAALGGQHVKPPVMAKAFVEGGRACVFNGPDVPSGASPDTPHADTVRVVLVTGPQAKKYFSDYRGKVHAQSISSLGDDAYYDGFASISVLKGHAYVRIAVVTPNGLSAEKTLAAEAVARM